MSQTWGELWGVCTEILGSSDEARFIIEQASGHSGAAWLLTTDSHATVSAMEAVHEMCRRRAEGEPLQYVLGRWGFRYLNLHVDQRALIPRPETEVLVDVALRVLRDLPAPQIVADLGTGTGAIALSIATELPTCEVFATDLSVDALELAKANLEEVNRTKKAIVDFSEGSWFEGLPSDLKGEFDVIISNPPYVAADDRDTISSEVLDWEPESALFAGPDGTNDLNHLIDNALEWLAPGGGLVVELAPEQANTLTERAEALGYAAVVVGPDLTGTERWLLAMKGA